MSLSGSADALPLGGSSTAAGGAGRSLVDQLSMPRRYVENLVLDGLARIVLSERVSAK